jgi:type IV pilus assembly protein PilF
MWLRLLLIVGILVGLTACSGGVREEKDKLHVADTNVRLGLGYLRQGRVEGALEKLQKALEVVPDYPEAHSSIALVYEQLGENDKASEHYERALELKPEDGSIHNNYAVFLCKLDKFEQAEPHFLSAIKARGYRTPDRALENLGMCAMGSGDREKAETYLRKALQMNPRLPGALLGMARLSYDKEQYLSGRAYLQRYQEVAPLGPDGLWLGIKVEEAMGSKDMAREYALRLRKQYPDSDEMRKLLEKEMQSQ